MRTGMLIPAVVAACCVSWAFGEATVGSLDVRTGVDLASEVNRGVKGIVIRARDVTVKGAKGKSLRFVAVAYKEGSDNTPSDYIDAKATSEPATWNEVVLELPFRALQGAFGKGSQSIYVIFYIVDMIDGVPHIIPGSYQAWPLTLDLGMEDFVDRHEADRKTNEAVIRSKRGRGSQYDALLEVAASYDLTIAIRQFTIGSKATRQLYSWEPLTDVDDGLLDRYVRVFVREWVKLPVDFVKKTGLRGVVFVKGLHYEGVKVGGGFDVDDRFVICEVNSAFRDEIIPHALFHEYMHIVDNLLCCRDYFDNEKWGGLNHPDATYSEKGAMDMIREDFGQIAQDHPAPGFLNGYSRADIYQDKAEVFAYLLITPYYRKAYEWLASDAFLAAKFAFMKKALGALSPSFTEEYFTKIHGGG